MKADNDNLPSSKMEAKAIGSKHFFTGEPCKRGHISKRYTSTGQCAECQYLHRLRWKADNPEKEKESRLLSVRAWVERNPERKKELARKSNAKPDVSANNVARAKKWNENNPDRAREIRLVSDRNRRALKRGSMGAHTKDDVAAILIRQRHRCAECGASVRKKNYRHVDHIVPLSKGGTNWPWNLQVLCPPCNLHNAAKDPIDFAQQKGRLL
ncbi:HNH endonuclease [Ochrobactrum sp. MT180101]|nr:HNH endonuclease [Ochrobactrum sp. MT180101]